MAREFDVVDKVMSILEKEFQYLLNNDSETYKGYNVVLTNEQQYVKKADRKPKTIFIIVKFLNGTQDYGQQRQPYALNVVTEHNSLEVCQKLLMDFSEENNLRHNFEFIDEDSESYSVKQTVSTVSNLSNFNEIFEGFRSVLYASGTFLIGINSNPVVKLELAFNDGYEDILEEIEFLSFQYSYDTQPDSQPFYGTNNFNRTVNKIATLSVGFTMYAVNTKFYNYITDLVFNDKWVNPDDESQTEHTLSIDKTFNLKIYFKSNPTKPKSVNMKLVSVSDVQELRDFPANSFTFVR